MVGFYTTLISILLTMLNLLFQISVSSQNVVPQVIRRQKGTLPPGLKVLGRQTLPRVTNAPVFTTPKPGPGRECKQGADPITKKCPPPPDNAFRFFGRKVYKPRKVNSTTLTAKKLFGRVAGRFWKMNLSMLRNQQRSQNLK